MTFVQVIDCKTSRVDDVNRLMDRWVQLTEGKRTATHSIVGTDRSDSTHLVEIVEFPSYEEAMKNSNLPETDQVFQELVKLCDEMPSFTDLDVVREEQLNKALARRYFDEVVARDMVDAYDELCTPGYIEHDPANPQDTLGRDEAKEAYRELASAFDTQNVSLDSIAAEGELVCCRFTVRARHSGEFQGIAPTGNAIEVGGHVTFRCEGGKIAESWFNWDTLGLLEQLGGRRRTPG
ncbi:ester cyclase [Streptomyces aidingensis]|uniref:Predicted ester cyclase n=1 Tax=Streptomyces aidingensis TaxID=910347 RepID=A0A1I1EAZ0_9ACTN|nr:ester cyclase [Streptomyces aidingensis]SFB83772.1 Predicted ester cyclase [Streptomyces aidingensis]